MSSEPSSRAAALAAEQVESIVAAAQAAADEIRDSARGDIQELRRRAEREAEAIKESARRQAIALTADARNDAGNIIADAQKESSQIREQTRRAVEGRVVAAEKAAAEVLEEARALSNGLRQLGQSLSSHAERILGDVQAAHKRMQADLRIGPGLEPTSSPRPARSGRSRARDEDDAELNEKLRTIREGVERSEGRTPPSSRPFEPISRSRGRSNPFDDLDVPSWVER